MAHRAQFLIYPCLCNQHITSRDSTAFGAQVWYCCVDCAIIRNEYFNQKSAGLYFILKQSIYVAIVPVSPIVTSQCRKLFVVSSFVSLPSLTVPFVGIGTCIKSQKIRLFGVTGSWILQCLHLRLILTGQCSLNSTNATSTTFKPLLSQTCVHLELGFACNWPLSLLPIEIFAM